MNKGLFALAILLPSALGWALTIFSVYVLGVYGALTFLVAPVIMGFYPPRILRRAGPPTLSLSFIAAAACIALFALGVIVFAVEGIICLVMAAPIGLGMAALGVLLERRMKGGKGKFHNSIPIFLVPIAVFPDLQAKQMPEAFAIRTQIRIEAAPEQVWKSVVGFPPITDAPSVWFKLGLAYPTHAEISGQGVGAIRRCHFSTGTFVEPVTEWKENEVLAFDVTEQPVPMRELSPWDIDPPHLHGYFRSVKGRFDLISRDGEATDLIGTTWCESHLIPNWYWRLWIGRVVHSIHLRVLTHIKSRSEV